MGRNLSKVFEYTEHLLMGGVWDLLSTICAVPDTVTEGVWGMDVSYRCICLIFRDIS